MNFEKFLKTPFFFTEHPLVAGLENSIRGVL